MSMELLKIDHVCLTVDSLKESKEYYEQLFGAKVTPRKHDAQILVVELPSVRFFLTKGYDAVPANQHLSFRVADLLHVESELTAHGIPFTTGEVHIFDRDNYRWIEWLDPSGIRLECVELL